MYFESIIVYGLMGVSAPSLHIQSTDSMIEPNILTATRLSSSVPI